MTKHLVDIDEDSLRAAKEILGITTIKDTVNGALSELGSSGRSQVNGQHRVPTNDLLIAAAADINGLIPLHYDADFERISKATGQAHEWVAKKGSL